MQIIFMTPGSGDNFYCENCLRDKAIVVALRAGGHDAMSVPLYLPTLLEDTSPGTDVPVFFGGINVWLQQHFKLFRHTPRWIDRLFDSRRLLRFAGRKADMTTAAELGKTTISMLRGPSGRQVKELDRLVNYLVENARPDVVVLSNALLLGMAEQLRERLDTAVVCMLQDEHDFVDALPPEYSQQAWELMGEKAAAVELFVAGSEYYARLMRERLGLASDRVKVVYNGIDPEGYVPAGGPAQTPTIGYLSRLHRDKGLDVLVRAFIELRKSDGLENLKLRIAGGMTQNDEAFVAGVRRELKSAGADNDVQWLEDFDRRAKRDFLPGLTVMCVPDRLGPASGLFVVESLLAGVPLVEPACGVLPELLKATGGGLLFKPGDFDDMAARLTALLTDPQRAYRMGQAGREVALERFTAQAAAARLAELFETLPKRSSGQPEGTGR